MCQDFPYRYIIAQVPSQKITDTIETCYSHFKKLKNLIIRKIDILTMHYDIFMVI